MSPKIYYLNTFSKWKKKYQKYIICILLCKWNKIYKCTKIKLKIITILNMTRSYHKNQPKIFSIILKIAGMWFCASHLSLQNFWQILVKLPEYWIYLLSLFKKHLRIVRKALNPEYHTMCLYLLRWQKAGVTGNTPVICKVCFRWQWRLARLRTVRLHQSPWRKRWASMQSLKYVLTVIYMSGL